MQTEKGGAVIFAKVDVDEAEVRKLLVVSMKEGNVLFNDALNTFILQLYKYGVGHVVKDHSDNERGNPLPPLHGLLFLIRSILYGGFLELFLAPASAARLVHALSCLWDGAYNRKE